MVVPLGPGKFYGNSLPRPRLYTDVKFNSDRVDPPVPVMDPFLSWANEAHWSMGGLSFKRLRLQGRIEGNVEKLRAEREKSLKKRNKDAIANQFGDLESDDEFEVKGKRNADVAFDSPPPAPIATKRRRYMAAIEEEDEENEQSVGESVEKPVERKRLARKLNDDFDRVSIQSPSQESESVAARTRSRRSVEQARSVTDEVTKKVVEEVSEEASKRKTLKRKAKNGGSGNSGAASSPRTSPRLAKLRS